MLQRLRMCLKTGGVVLFCLLILSPCAYADDAISVTSPPEKLPNSPLIISAYGSEALFTVENSIVGTVPRYIEIYNIENTAVIMNGWQLTVGFSNGSDVSIDLSGSFYLQPHGYAVVSFNNAVQMQFIKLISQTICPIL